MKTEIYVTIDKFKNKFKGNVNIDKSVSIGIKILQKRGKEKKLYATQQTSEAGCQ